MSVAETHKERASSDFRDGLLNVVAGQGMIDEPARPCPFACGFAEFSSESIFFFCDSKIIVVKNSQIVTHTCFSSFKFCHQILFTDINNFPDPPTI